MSEPRDHHYTPQFYLRSFAVDAERRKIMTVFKRGQLAVWSQRSIERLGFERDLYVHFQAGRPVSVETAINRRIETPISQSDTWQKIVSGRTDALDRSDKPILYALIRHLEARTPHYHATQMELARMAASADSEIPFTDEERELYAFMRRNPDLAKAIFNTMSASLEWTESAYDGAGMSIMRSTVPLRSSTTPVLVMPSPAHPSLKLPLPGLQPYQYVLPLNPTTAVSLVVAGIDDAFINSAVPSDVALGLNRYFVGQFGHFENVHHLITSREGLTEEMAWARYELIENTDRKMVFRRDLSYLVNR